jgi:hypothetical protein
LISIILGLAVAGFLVWLILQIPAPPIFKNIIMGVVVLCLILWVLRGLGYGGALPQWR